MDPITIIVTALALGAAAGLQETAEQAVKDAYAGLKRIIQDRYERARRAVELLEEDPEDETFQAAAGKALSKTEAGSDEELLRQAQALIESVEQHAPEAASAINLNLADIKAAANIRIAELSATVFVNVEIKGAEPGGDFEVRGLSAGGDGDSKKAAGE